MSKVKEDAYCSATEAARALGVKVETLYAYASRRQLTSVPIEGSRRRNYLRREVEELRLRHRRVRNPDSAARSALDWGLPVLDTKLTLIEHGRFYYRGLEATELARTSTLERVAALLWLGSQEQESELFGESLQAVSPLWQQAVRGAEASHPSAGLLLAVQLAEIEDVRAGDTIAQASAETGARILRCMVAAAVGLGRRRRGPLVNVLVSSWCRDRRSLVGPFNTALILCADHELNISSFSARCVASAGATIYQAVCGGLCALRGFRHGGHCDRVEALLREIGVAADRPSPSRAQIRRRLRARLDRGEQLPGFGQPLYPEGDPRYPAIVSALEEAVPRSRVVRGARFLAEEGAGLTGMQPTLDLGLGTLAAEAGLPLGGAWTVFAVGRAVGWIAHALEEHRRGKLIRPRARYVGVSPEEKGHSA